MNGQLGMLRHKLQRTAGLRSEVSPSTISEVASLRTLQLYVLSERRIWNNPDGPLGHALPFFGKQFGPVPFVHLSFFWMLLELTNKPRYIGLDPFSRAASSCDLTYQKAVPSGPRGSRNFFAMHGIENDVNQICIKPFSKLLKCIMSIRVLREILKSDKCPKFRTCRGKRS